MNPIVSGYSNRFGMPEASLAFRSRKAGQSFELAKVGAAVPTKQMRLVSEGLLVYRGRTEKATEVRALKAAVRRQISLYK